ncbi:hypothetical protein C8R44DRAFT_821848 [Mycena epipterygia]|nr:hypothetical protein C8R44DRAFT_821848 [Mycena epipterygia]
MEPNLLLPVWSSRSGQEFKDIRDFDSVHVRVVATRSKEAGPLTLIRFGRDAKSSLSLGEHPIFREGTIRGSELTRIIPLITIPALRVLRIHQDVDTTALHQFLCRHPTIDSIHYGVEETDGQQLLTRAPLVLPSLSVLFCSDAVQMIPLLNTLGLSPQLSDIQIIFNRHTPAQVDSFKRGLRRLSLHTAPTFLHIFVWVRQLDPLPVDDEERLIIGCLYSVHSVHLKAKGTPEVQEPVRWLRMLPALAHLELDISSLHESVADVSATARASTLDMVRAELPSVAVRLL